MDDTTIGCNVCGANAKVLDAAPVYGSTMYLSDSGEFETAVLETHFDIDCPACGVRTQDVPAA